MPLLKLTLSLVGIADLGPSVPLVMPVRDGAIPDAFSAVARAAGFKGKPGETLLVPDRGGASGPGRDVLLLGIDDALRPKQAAPGPRRAYPPVAKSPSMGAGCGAPLPWRS